MGYGSKSLNDWRDEVTSIARSKGFEITNPAESIALMHSELSEALEDVRSGVPINDMWYVDEANTKTRDGGPIDKPHKPCGVPSEMADALIRILHFCGHYGIDIESAVRQKSYYNEHRPHMHGGKKF